jgi:hypothetical protein
MPRGKIKTHKDWLTCNQPGPLYTVIGRQSHSMRKSRLLACAAARKTWATLDDRFRQAVQRAERFADGEMTAKAFAKGVRGVHDAIMKIWHSVNDDKVGSMKAARFRAPYLAVECATTPEDEDLAPRLAMDWVCMLAPRSETWPWHCNVLRDIFGYPFRSVTTDMVCVVLPVTPQSLSRRPCMPSMPSTACRSWPMPWKTPAARTRTSWRTAAVAGNTRAVAG